jgi:hypothetical protein
VQGEAEPLVEKTHRAACTACRAIGTITVQTFPLQSAQALEMDLCPEHLRGLLGRRLPSHTYGQMRRQLSKLGVDISNVFLLHEVFYDEKGRPLQPAAEPG